jgi:hypothetical protein
MIEKWSTLIQNKLGNEKYDTQQLRVYELSFKMLLVLALFIGLSEIAFSVYAQFVWYYNTTCWQSWPVIIKIVLVILWMTTYIFWLICVKRKQSRFLHPLEYGHCIFSTGYYIYQTESIIDPRFQSNCGNGSNTDYLLFLSFETGWRYLYISLLFKGWPTKVIQCTALAIYCMVKTDQYALAYDYFVTRGKG